VNSDVEYVLRIVLKARDEMSLVLGKAAAELRAFEESVKGLDGRLNAINQRMRTFNNRIRDARENLGELKKASDDTGGSVRLVTVAEDDLTDSIERGSRASNERLRTELNEHLQTQRNARSKTEAAAAEKEATAAKTKAVEEDTVAIAANSAAVRQRMQEQGFDFAAQTRALEVEQKRVEERQKAATAFRRDRESLDLPKKGEITKERLGELDEHQLETFTRAQERFNDALAKENRQREKRVELQQLEKSTRLETAQQLTLEAIQAEQAASGEEALSKAKVKTAKAKIAKAEATKVETAAEEASTEATKKSDAAAETKSRKDSRRKQSADQRDAEIKAKRERDKEAARADAEEEAASLKREADLAEQEAERFAAAEAKKTEAVSKGALSRRQKREAEMERANREMLAGIQDEPHAGGGFGGHEDLGRLVNIEREVDIGDRFAEQGGPDEGFGPFGGFGGGAPRRDPIRKSEVDAGVTQRHLRSLELDIQRASQALDKMFGGFGEGNEKVDRLVKLVEQADQAFDRFTRRITEIRGATADDLQKFLEAPQALRRQLADLQAGLPEEKQAELGRALRKSDVGEQPTPGRDTPVPVRVVETDERARIREPREDVRHVTPEQRDVMREMQQTGRAVVSNVFRGEGETLTIRVKFVKGPAAERGVEQIWDVGPGGMASESVRLIQQLRHGEAPRGTDDERDFRRAQNTASAIDKLLEGLNPENIRETVQGLKNLREALPEIAHGRDPRGRTENIADSLRGSISKLIAAMDNAQEAMDLPHGARPELAQRLIDSYVNRDTIRKFSDYFASDFLDRVKVEQRRNQLGDEGFGPFGAAAGAAPRKSAAEQRAAADAANLRKSEVRQLEKLRTEYETASGSFGKLVDQFRRGNVDADLFIERIKGVQSRLNSLRNDLRKLLVAPGREEALRDVLDAPGEMVGKIEQALSGKRVSEENRAKVGQFIGKSDVAEESGQATRQVTEEVRKATTAEEGHRKKLTEVEDEAIRLTRRYHALRDELREGKITSDQAADGFQDIATALSRVRQRDPGGGLGRIVGDLAREARDTSEAIRNETSQLTRNAAETRRSEEANNRLRKEADELHLSYERLLHRIDSGQENWVAARNQVRGFANDMERVSRRLTNVDPGREFRLGASAEHARTTIRNLTRDQDGYSRSARDAQRATSGIVGFFNRLADNANRAGGSVARVDNELRGMIVLAVMAFAEQLITLLLSAAGAATSLASSAAFAGAAIGGALVAGIAQALPVLGLFVASFLRVKQVMDAVQQAQLVDQQNFQRQNDNRKKQADTSDQVANAEDSVKNAEQGVADAHRRLADSQRALTNARRDAQRQLRDLIFAERDAELQARGAALSQADAQEALRRAVTGGDVAGLSGAELNVLETRQSRREANARLTDATADASRLVPKGVEGQDNVRQARQQVDDSRRAIDQANRAVVQAQRGLERAKRASDAAADDSFSGLEKLQFMLQKQLSPAERELFNRIQRFRKVFQEQFRPITDILIREYSKGVDTAIKLLQDHRIIGAARGLAQGVARELGRTRRDFTSDSVIQQLIRISGEAKRNLAPVGEIVRNIAHILLNIAEDAGPSLKRLLDWFVGLTERFRAVTDDRGRMAAFFKVATDNAIAWLDAIEAIVKMFAALAGIAQGEGFSMIQELTDWANRTTENIKNNRTAVADFFHQSHEVLKMFLELLGAVGKAAFEVFSPNRLRPFFDFIEHIMLPALVQAVQLIGGMTSFLMFLVTTIPGIGYLTKILVTLLLVSKVITSLRTLTQMMSVNLASFFHVLDSLTGSRLNRSTAQVASNFGKMVSYVGELLKKIPLLNRTRLPDFLTGRGRRIEESTLAQVPARKGMTRAEQRAAEAEQKTFRQGGPAYSYPVGPREPVPVEEETRRRSRLGRIGRGVGIAGLVGAGAVALTRGQAGDLQDITNKSRFGIGLDQLTGFGRQAFSLDIGGMFKTVTGSTDAVKLRNFTRDFDKQLQTLTKRRDVKGLEDLAKHARDLGKEFPLYADALNKAADAAENSATKNKTLNDDLRATQKVSGQLRREGIVLDYKTRGRTPVQLLDDLRFYLKNLREGVPRDMAALRRDVQDEVKRINAALIIDGVKRPAWFQAMANTYDAAIDNVRRLRREGKISASEASKQIDELHHNIRLFRARDPFNVGEEFASSLAKTKGSRQHAINEFVQQLGQMPQAARRDATAMAVASIEQMAKKQPALRDTAKRFVATVGGRFRDMRDINTRRTGTLVDNVISAFGELPKGVADSLDILRDMMKDSLHALGLSNVRWPPMARRAGTDRRGRPRFSNVPGLVDTNEGGATGGRFGRIGLKGERGRDQRPTWLGAGELVLNHWHEMAVNAQLPGQQTVADIVDRVRGLHAGSIGDAVGMAAGGYALGGIHAGIRKAALSVLEKYPQLVVTSTTSGGHAKNSYHYKGEAVDIGGPAAIMNAAAQWIARSTLGRQLTEGIHNPGLSIKDGRRVSPGFWGATTWAAHANHIHLAVAGAIGDIVGGLVQQLGRVRLGGPQGNARTLGQRVIDRVRNAANRYLNDQAGGGDFQMESVRGGMPRAAVERVINTAMRLVGIPGNIRGAWRSMSLARSHQESGWNPNAQNNWDVNAQRGDPSRGLFQTIGATFKAYALPGHRNILNPLDNAVAAFRYMLSAYGRGSWALALSRMLGRAGVGYASGGPIPGFGGGDQVPVMLERGEHVFTKEEVQAAGGHDVIRKLRQLLGGGGQGGPMGYQAGGDVAAIDQPFTSAGQLARVRAALRGRYALPVLPLVDWQDVVDEIHRAAIALKRSASSWRGRIHEIAQAITKIHTDHDREIVKDIAELKKGGVTRSEALKIRRLRDQELSKKDQDEIKDLQKERDDLRRNRGGVRQRFVRGQLLSNIDAITREGGLIETVDTVRQRVAAQRQRAITFTRLALTGRGRNRRVTQRGDPVDLAQQNVAAAQQDLAGIQDQENLITTTRSTVQAELRRLRRGGVSPKEAAQVRRLQTQLAALRTAFDNIRDAHAQALQTYYEQETAAQQAAVDAINKNADNANALNERFRRVWTALGNTDMIAQVNKAQREIMANQANDLERQIAAANRIGNTDLADQLTSQVQDLRTSIFESIQQELRDAADQISQRAQRRMGRLDLFGRMQQALGRLGLDSVVNVGGEVLSARGVAEARMNTLTDQRTGLQTLLQRVMTESPQNIQLIQDLTDQLAELDVTIQENTKAYFDARVQDVNDRFGRSTTTLDLRRQILDIQGQISGTPDTQAMLGIENERTGYLKIQADALTALLEEARNSGNEQAINDLSDQLLQNQIAMLQNTQAINELNGTVQQPQGFSSSAWEWFRMAIFTGMGDVLPRYVIPSADVGGIATKSGLAMIHSNEAVVPAHITKHDFGNSSDAGDINIEINEAGGPIDYVELASTVAWAKKTAQVPRR
jgi:hypothetical protein